jgi:hypothetical protein
MRALHGDGKVSFAAEDQARAPQGQPNMRDGRAGGVLFELAADGPPTLNPVATQTAQKTAGSIAGRQRNPVHAR